MPRYFEDLSVGTVRDLGSVTLSAEEIVAFAEQWDPLPQHVDESRAGGTPSGELVASGLHTICLSNRLATDGYRRDLAGVVGLGFSNLQFPAPVRPGDELRFYHEVVETRPSESNPSVGVVRTRIHGENAEGVRVLEYDVSTLVSRRPDGGAGGGDDPDA